MPMPDDDDLFLDAIQASELLGVSTATLYSYVSRKRVRSEPIEGTRSRKYWKADIERLARRAPDATNAPAQAPLLSLSRITLLTNGGLYFRGQDAIRLSESLSLESLAALLWQADEAKAFGKAPADASKTWQQLRTSMQELSVQERAIAMFPMIERADPRAYDLSPEGFARTGAAVLRWYATLLVQAAKPSDQPLHIFVARALKAPPGFEDVIRRLLVLSADHEFDPITYAVRAVANVGVTPYQAATIGLIAIQGQRIQAERFGAARRFLEEILGEKDGRIAAIRRLRTGEPLPGFIGGSSPTDVDPRAVALTQALDLALDDDREWMQLKEAAQVIFEATGKSANFIVPALFIGRRLGLRGNELALAGLGRLAGWIAHAMEQFHDNPLIRPRATYVGQLPAGNPPA